MLMVLVLIIGVYFIFIELKYVVIVVVFNLFGGFIIVFIINFYKVNEEDDKLLIDENEIKK